MEKKVPAVRKAGSLLKKFLEERQDIKETDFYDVGGGKREPSARVWRLWANLQKIQTEFLVDEGGNPCVGLNQEEAWARIRGWKERDGKIEQRVESSTTILFENELQDLILTAIDKGIYDPLLKKRVEVKYEIVDGKPVLTDKKQQLHILREFTRIKKFGDRIAVTKAESIVIKKLLGVEWREEEEIKHEEREVEIVNQTKIISSSETKIQAPTVEQAQPKIEEPPASSEASTPKQRQLIHSLYKKAGLSEQDYYLMLWHDFGKKSSTELTLEEAERLIKILETQIPPELPIDEMK